MKHLLMKKYLIVIAAAAVLAGCAKTEVIAPDGNAPAEITFTTAPVTKAVFSFDTDNVFQTYAVYTAGDYSYSASASFEQFIDFSTVMCSSGTWRIDSDKDGDIDSDDTSYFWPKDGGKLSFFSWSLNTGSLKFADGTTPKVRFANTRGLYLSNYVSGNDFMVADPALSQTGNSGYYYRFGVPTLFRHKAAQIIFKIKTAQAYSGKTFTLKSISFKNVSTEGTYSQGSAPTSSPSTEAWTAESSNETTDYSTVGMTIPAVEAEDVPSNGVSILIPQSFSDTDGKYLTLTYSITSGSTTTTKTATVKMNTLLGGSSSVSAALEKGKKYTITLSISSGNEILWTPEVVDWVDEAKTISVTES